jgi:nitroreductase
MNVLQALRERRSVRDYKQEAVSAGMIYQLISSASWAPSAMNGQACHFTVITDGALLDEISIRAKAWLLKNVSTLPHATHFRDLLGDEKFHMLYRAPALIIISTPIQNQWAREDCSVAAQNLMLAAASLELGSCWIGFAQSWLNTPEAQNLLNLSALDICVAPIVVGHPKAVLPAVPRKAPAVTWLGKSEHFYPDVPLEPAAP